MSRTKKILLAIVIVFIGIQFIRPARNKSQQVLPTDITRMAVSLPDSTRIILEKACYDCHSNNTDYPWYSNIQPIGWLLTRHIKQGKAALNFSEFGSYSSRKQISKLTGIANSTRDGDMPLSSYKWLHKNARLRDIEKMMIMDWAQRSKDSLTVKNQ